MGSCQPGREERKSLLLRPPTGLLLAVATVLIAGGIPGLAASELSPMAFDRRYETSKSTLWRGSPDLRFKTVYASGTVLEGFICSDLLSIGSPPRLDTA